MKKNIIALAVAATCAANSVGSFGAAMTHSKRNSYTNGYQPKKRYMSKKQRRGL